MRLTEVLVRKFAENKGSSIEVGVISMHTEITMMAIQTQSVPYKMGRRIRELSARVLLIYCE